MINRDSAVEQMKGWLKAERTSLGLKALKRTPTAKVDSEMFPAIFIFEGDDQIVKESRQFRSGFPAERVVEVIFEMWNHDTDGENIRELYVQVRNILFRSKLSNSCAIKELRAFGPFNSGTPGAVCMQLVVALSYTDPGPAI